MRTLILSLLTAAMLTATGTAHAGQVEPADRTVKRVQVTYAEPIPTKRHPNRHYFETNDGAAYVYGGFTTCKRRDEVPNRVCRTVFWYAR